VPSFLQWVSSGKPKRYRITVIHGEDAVLRAEALDTAVRLAGAQEATYLHAGRSGDSEAATAAQIWDAVFTQPMPGISRRLVVIHHADKMRDRSWTNLKTFIEGAKAFPETSLVLVLDRNRLGKRVRNREKSLPGAPVWEDSYEEWESSLRDYTGAGVISCASLSADQQDPTKPSSAQRWLSLQVPISQRQAEFLWRRVGGSTLLARDVVRTFVLLGYTDLTALATSEFQERVQLIAGMYGAEDFVEHLLFDRKLEAFASISDQTFEHSDWRKILGLLAQRVDWLSALHGALATGEHLDQVMRRLQIPRHMILHYAHRGDQRFNIARKFDLTRVRRCRNLIADFDSRLGSSQVVPLGFGESLIASWSPTG